LGLYLCRLHVLLQKLQVSNRTQAALIWLATEGRQ
jgi:DNA-binding NarL/FixJ family response regulator